MTGPGDGSATHGGGSWQPPPPPFGPPTPADGPPGQPYPGQPYPGQPYPGQPYPGQPYPGQPYPGQPYPGQPYPGQPYPGQPYPGQPYPGQPYPGQPHAVPGYSEPPYAGPAYPGQVPPEAYLDARWAAFGAGPQALPSRPAALEWAFRLMLARAGLSVVNLVVLFAGLGALRRQVDDRVSTAGGGTAFADTVITTTVTIGAVFGLIFVVLYVLLAFQVRRGKQWARVTTWVFAGLGALSVLGLLSSAGTVATHVVGVLLALLDVAIIVALAQRATSDYVEAVRDRSH